MSQARRRRALGVSSNEARHQRTEDDRVDRRRDVAGAQGSGGRASRSTGRNGLARDDDVRTTSGPQARRRPLPLRAPVASKVNPRVRRIALLLSFASAAASATPQIPLCPGLTIVTAVSQPNGDYESIKTIESVGPKEVRLKYVSEAMNMDGLSPTAGEIISTTVHRKLLTEDLRLPPASISRSSLRIRTSSFLARRRSVRLLMYCAHSRRRAKGRCRFRSRRQASR